jgi:polyphosphate kinase
MNAIVDLDVINALYAASQAGVEIRLYVRGVCCLRPGIPGLSERITVRALIDRFLEHKRMFRFANGGIEEYYFSSADWMPRNFQRRVEVLVPLLDPSTKARVEDMLNVLASDTAKTWVLEADGRYTKLAAPAGTTPLRSQQRFIEATRERHKPLDALSRGGRFHIFQVGHGEGDEMRRKNGKKKKGQQSS